MTAEDNQNIRPYRSSTQDVADHFGVHRNTVYGWLESDDPPPHRKAGKDYRFNLAEVDAWAARRNEAA